MFNVVILLTIFFPVAFCSVGWPIETRTSDSSSVGLWWRWEGSCPPWCLSSPTTPSWSSTVPCSAWPRVSDRGLSSPLHTAIYWHVWCSAFVYLYLDIGECVCVCVSFWAYTRRPLWSDRDQIRHTHGDSSRNGNGRNKNYPVWSWGHLGGFRGQKITNLE